MDYFSYFLCIDAVAYGRARFSAGNGPIYLNSVNCSGLESHLQTCSFSSMPAGCTHSNDASVGCRAESK